MKYSPGSETEALQNGGFMEAAGIEPARHSPGGWVYVVRGGQGYTTRFKIGWTKGDPRKRLKDLQVGSPTELELMGAVPGTRADEARMHREWELYRSHGEWFHLCPGLFELLVEHAEFPHELIVETRRRRAWFAERDKEEAA